MVDLWVNYSYDENIVILTSEYAMVTLRQDINNLVKAGAQHHPSDTKKALKALKNCKNYDELDTAVEGMPDTCRAWAQRIMRRAKQEGTTPMMILNHVDDARMTHMPKSVSVSGAINFYGEYHEAAEALGFCYFT